MTLYQRMEVSSAVEAARPRGHVTTTSPALSAVDLLDACDHLGTRTLSSTSGEDSTEDIEWLNTFSLPPHHLTPSPPHPHQHLAPAPDRAALGDQQRSQPHQLSAPATQPLSNSATQPLSLSKTQPVSHSAPQPLSPSSAQLLTAPSPTPAPFSALAAQPLSSSAPQPPDSQAAEGATASSGSFRTSNLEQDGAEGLRGSEEIPLIVYLHRAVVFLCAFLRCDGFSIGYFILFLFGSTELSNSQHWALGPSAAQPRSWLNLFGVKGWLAFYFLLAGLWSIGACIGHVVVDVQSHFLDQGHKNSSTSVDQAIFFLCITVALDMVVLITNYAILSKQRHLRANAVASQLPATHKKAQAVAPSLYWRGAMVHGLGVLIISLHPSVIGVGYLLFVVYNLWLVGSGRDFLNPGSLQRRCRLIGGFAALHMVAIYGVQLLPVDVADNVWNCKTLNTVGLAFFRNFTWSTWASVVGQLCLFLISFSGDKISGEDGDGPVLRASSRPKGRGDGRSTEGGLAEPLVNQEATSGEGQDAQLSAPQPQSLAASINIESVDEGGYYLGLGALAFQESSGLLLGFEYRHQEMEWVMVRSSALLLVAWGSLLPSVLGAFLLAGGMQLLALKFLPSQTDASRRLSTLLITCTYVTLMIVAQFTFELVNSESSPCESVPQANASLATTAFLPSGERSPIQMEMLGLSNTNSTVEWTTLQTIGLVPYNDTCGVGGSSQAWPDCLGTLQVLMQQVVLHFLFFSLYLSRKSSLQFDDSIERRGSQMDKRNSTDSRRGSGSEVEMNSTRVDKRPPKASATWEFLEKLSISFKVYTNILAIVIVLCSGLGAADLIHCGYLAIAISCSVSDQARIRMWPIALYYVAGANILTYLWHCLTFLPPNHIIGIGLHRDRALWSWNVCGVHAVNFILIAFQYDLVLRGRDALRSRLASRSSGDLSGPQSQSGSNHRSRSQGDGTSPDSQAPSSTDVRFQDAPTERRKSNDEDEDSDDFVMWNPLPQVFQRIGDTSIDFRDKVETQMRTAWRVVGYMIIYLIMLFHGIGLTLVGEWFWFHLHTHPTVIEITYVLFVFALVTVHSIKGWQGEGLLLASRLWYVIMPTAVAMSALRYFAQFKGVYSTLERLCGAMLLADLGLAKAADGDLFLNLIGDAAVVSLMIAQVSRLRDSALAVREQTWVKVWEAVLATLGVIPLQIALFIAVGSEPTVIGVGYLMLLIFVLVLPAKASKYWIIPQVYAQFVCLFQMIMQLSEIQAILHGTDAEDKGRIEFWHWLGVKSLQDPQNGPARVFLMILPDLMVILASVLVTVSDEATLETYLQGRSVWFRKILTFFWDIPVKITYHMTIAGTLVASSLTDTVMVIFFQIFFIVFVSIETYSVKIWDFINTILGFLLMIRKILQLVTSFPQHTAPHTMTLRDSCLYKWIGLLPEFSSDETWTRLSFIMPMILISLHIRTMIRDLKDMRITGTNRLVTEVSTTSSQFHLSDVSSDDASVQREISLRRMSSLQLPLELGTATSNWMLWAITQVVIGGALMLLFWLLMSGQQTIVTVAILLTIVHAVCTQSCIRALSLRLQIILFALLLLDALFQAPVPLFYTIDPEGTEAGTIPVAYNNQTSLWREACLGNATTFTMVAEIVGIQAGMGSVAIRPILAFLCVMLLHLLLNSPWYIEQEEAVAEESKESRKKKKWVHWALAERDRRAKKIADAEAELLRSRTRIDTLKQLMAGAKDNTDTPASKYKSPRQGQLKEKQLERQIKGYFENQDFSESTNFSEQETESEEADSRPSSQTAAPKRKMDSVLKAFLKNILVSIINSTRVYLQRNPLAFSPNPPVLAPGGGGSVHAAASSMTSPTPARETGSGDVEDLSKASFQTLLLIILELAGATFSMNTHYVSYAAIVIRHALAQNPASGFLVVFMLSIAVFQDPFPARWHWIACMCYLAVLGSVKVIAQLLEERICVAPIHDSFLCSIFLPVWFDLAGNEVGSAIIDFVTLLVIAAHRANMQHRGLWRDVSSLDLAPRKPDAGGEKETRITELTPQRKDGSLEGKTWSEWAKTTFWLPRRSHGEFGTGVDLYMLVITPELLAMILFFAGLLMSGAGAQNNLENLAKGGAVDWSTLAWVSLALLQFVNIVLDRVLYLRRSIRTKAGLQLVTLIFWFSMFFFRMAQPLLSQSSLFVLVLYGLKCWYWIISAVQIRRGYEVITRGNWFYRDFSYNSYYLYMCYSLVPFLMDLRGMLDWTYTRTTLEFYQWMKLEAIFALLHQRQVLVTWRRTLGRGFGKPQPRYLKLLLGVGYFVGLALVIWAPLLISVVSAKYAQPRQMPIQSVQMDVSLATNLGDRFTLSSLFPVDQYILPVPANCSTSIFHEQTEWLKIKDRETAVKALEENCALKDTFNRIEMTSETTMWMPTPVRKMQLLNALRANTTSMHLLTQITYTRNTSGIPQAPAGQRQYEPRVVQELKSPALSDEQCDKLIQMITTGNGSVVVPHFLEPLVSLSADTAAPLRYGMPWAQSIRLVLNEMAVESELQDTRLPVEYGNHWWSICCDGASRYCKAGSGKTAGHCGGIWLLAAVDPGSLNVLSKLGLSLVTVYTIFVLAIGRAVRSVFTGDVPLTMYKELPECDKLWALVNDIYTARYHDDLVLEEELYTILVDIYRSPETLLQLTGRG